MSVPKKSYVQPEVVPLSPQKANHNSRYRPSHSTLTSSGAEFSSNASQENTYAHQYPYESQQNQSYPSYPYAQDSYTFQGTPYVSQDSMPVPEHFNSEGQPYPPLSPTMQNSYSYSHHPQYPIYNTQHNWGPQPNINSFVAGRVESATLMYPPMVNNQTDKTTNTSFIDTLLSQKVETNGIKTDKEEYHQKPDTVSNVQTIYDKPNDVKDQYSKPHEREI